MPIVFGWVIGVFVGAILALATLTGAGLPISGALVAALGAVLGTILTPVLALAAALAQLLSFILIPLAGLLLTLINVLIPNLPIAIGPLIIALFLFAGAILIGIADLIGYVFASRSIAPFLPGLIAPTPLVIPTGGLVPPPNGIPPSGVSVAVPPSTGESFIRGVLIGISSAANAVFLFAIPVGGWVLAAAAFVLNSLAIARPVAISPFYQGFLGLFAWLFPLAYIATLVGLALFILNLPFALAAAVLFGSPFPARIDFTTGVIETHGGITGIPGAPGPATSPTGGPAFSLGNFTFLYPTAPLPTPGDFRLASVSSHETGHTLNTAAMGGYVLWINAVDETVMWNLAYGELLAEGHSAGFPLPLVGPPEIGFFVRQWS